LIAATFSLLIFLFYVLVVLIIPALIAVYGASLFPLVGTRGLDRWALWLRGRLTRRRRR